MSGMYRIVSKHKQKTIFCIGNGNAESNLNNLFQFLQIFSCQKTDTVGSDGDAGAWSVCLSTFSLPEMSNLGFDV